MNSENFIKELEFTLNTNPYKYEYGEIMYKNKFGHWCGLFKLTIDTDDRVFCYGLEDKRIDEPLTKCKECGAFVYNAKPLKELQNGDNT